jgi:methionine-rich copper-binding protein CopC
VLVTAIAATVLLGAPAQAHAKLLSSSPAAGATVGPRLHAIVLTFDDVVQLVPRSMVVTGAGGAPLTARPPQLTSPRVMQLRMPDRLAPGPYFVAWRILADDGHIESGTLSFTISAAATTSAPMSAAPPAPEQPLWPVVVAAVLAGVALAGAGLVVWRGGRALTAPTAASGDYPASSAARGTSPSDHGLLRR